MDIVRAEEERITDIVADADSSVSQSEDSSSAICPHLRQSDRCSRCDTQVDLHEHGERVHRWSGQHHCLDADAKSHGAASHEKCISFLKSVSKRPQLQTAENIVKIFESQGLSHVVESMVRGSCQDRGKEL